FAIDEGGLTTEAARNRFVDEIVYGVIWLPLQQIFQHLPSLAPHSMPAAHRSQYLAAITPNDRVLRLPHPDGGRRKAQRCVYLTERPAFLASRPVLEEIQPNERMEDTPMEIIPLRPGFGAELRGVTLADIAAHDAAYQEVRAAFEEYSLLVLRNQDVSNESQLAFSRRFGPPEITKVGSLGTGTHFVILTTIGPDGKVVPPDHRYAMRNKANQLWHTDSSFKSVPA